MIRGPGQRASSVSVCNCATVRSELPRAGGRAVAHLTSTDAYATPLTVHVLPARLQSLRVARTVAVALYRRAVEICQLIRVLDAVARLFPLQDDRARRVVEEQVAQRVERVVVAVARVPLVHPRELPARRLGSVRRGPLRRRGRGQTCTARAGTGQASERRIFGHPHYSCDAQRWRCWSRSAVGGGR